MSFNFSDIDVGSGWADSIKYRSIFVSLHYMPKTTGSVYNAAIKSPYTIGDIIAENEYLSIIVDDITTTTDNPEYPEIKTLESVKLKFLFLKDDMSIFAKTDILPHTLFVQCILNPGYIDKIHIEGETCLLYPYEFINKKLVPKLFMVCKNLENYTMSNMHFIEEDEAILNLYIRHNLRYVEFRNIQNVKVNVFDCETKVNWLKTDGLCKFVTNDDCKICLSDIEGLCKVV